MNRKSFTTFIYLFACCFFLSCGDDLSERSASTSTDGSAAEEDELERLSPEERALIDTNPLITGILDSKPKEHLRKHLAHLMIPNGQGDVALGVAIKQRKPAEALFTLNNMTCGQLLHTNNEEESFIYLASKKAYPTLISAMAKKCYDAQGKEWWDGEDYEFYELDTPTKTGDIALHVAANALVAEVLAYEYEDRGAEASPLPGWTFYEHTNQEGRTFLHKAAADGRIDVIKWATKREKCDRRPSESESFWEKTVAYGTSIWNKLQTKTWNITNLITQQDNNDDTALHLAANALNEEAIRAIASCPWVDYSSTNSDGDIPLQSFLKALDKSQTSHRESLKEGFELLFHTETTKKNWNAYKVQLEESVLANHLNKASDFSLHTATGIADLFLYNYLKQPTHRERREEGFGLLSHTETTKKNWNAYKNQFEVSALANHLNEDSDSSLHIAARIADPFFYNYLKQFGDTLLKNNQGITPKQIFDSTHLQRSTQESAAI